MILILPRKLIKSRKMKWNDIYAHSPKKTVTAMANKKKRSFFFLFIINNINMISIKLFEMMFIYSFLILN